MSNASVVSEIAPGEITSLETVSAPATPPAVTTPFPIYDKYTKRLTKVQWAEAKALWRGGAHTLAMLSQKFDVTKETLGKRFKKDGCIKGEATVERELQGRLEAAALEDASKIASRVKETKEECYTWSRAFQRMAVAEVAAAKQSKIPVESVAKNLKAIETAMNIIKIGREERYALLGMDKDDAQDEELPTLVVKRMSDEEQEQLRRSKAIADEFISEELMLGEPPVGESIDDADDGVDELLGPSVETPAERGRSVEETEEEMLKREEGETE